MLNQVLAPRNKTFVIMWQNKWSRGVFFCMRGNRPWGLGQGFLCHCLYITHPIANSKILAWSFSGSFCSCRLYKQQQTDRYTSRKTLQLAGYDVTNIPAEKVQVPPLASGASSAAVLSSAIGSATSTAGQRGSHSIVANTVRLFATSTIIHLSWIMFAYNYSVLFWCFYLIYETIIKSPASTSFKLIFCDVFHFPWQIIIQIQ